MQHLEHALLHERADTAHDDTLLNDLDHMKEEVARLMHEVEGKNQVIKLQSDEIGWLRGECAKLTDRILLLFPHHRNTGGCSGAMDDYSGTYYSYVSSNSPVRKWVRSPVTRTIPSVPSGNGS
jgi:hypothetical protein